MKKFIIALIFFFIPFICLNADTEKQIDVYLFYSDSCPHCHDALEYLNQVKEEKNLIINKYEVTKNQENMELFYNVQKYLNEESSSVPYIVIGNQVIIGFSSSIQNDIENIIDYYEENDYRDILGEYLGYKEVDNSINLEKSIDFTTKEVPVLGEIDAKNVSLPILSVVVGFVDGFNPCAMWVLIFLISMMLGMKNRKRMWILGITFLITSGLVYGLIMTSFLNLEILVNKINIVKILIALFAVSFGIWNLYSFYKTKDTGCKLVKPSKRKKIMEKIKKVTTEKSFIIAIVGIIVLALSVNAIELLCSLGLPAVFTQILAINNLNFFEYILYITIYILFFMIDDIIIFILAMKTTKINNFGEKYAKYSHLIGGLLMIIIGILLIFKPEWLMFNF